MELLYKRYYLIAVVSNNHSRFEKRRDTVVGTNLFLGDGQVGTDGQGHVNVFADLHQKNEKHRAVEHSKKNKSRHEKYKKYHHTT